MNDPLMNGSGAKRIWPWTGLPVSSRALLLLALIFHLTLVIPWPMSLWTYFTFDSAATRGQRGWDFYALYQAGHNALAGISVYESDGSKIEVVVPPFTAYRYLPISAYTLGVLSNALRAPLAFGLWAGLVELVLLGCAHFCWRLEKDPVRGAGLAAMWLCFTPYYLESYFGQFSLVQAALILVMMVATLRPLGWRYDLAWIASLLWKQNTGLFVPLYLRQRRWRALGFAVAAILLTSGPYFALYPGTLRAFLANFESGPPNPQLGNLGVRQLLYSLVSALAPALPAATHALLQQAWVVGILALALWLTWRGRQPDALLLLCFWTTTYFLVYHHIWEHHYVLLLPVFVLLYRRTRSRAVLILYVLVAIWTPYILIDPRGMAGYHMPIRWTPLEPRILDVGYHACKALPTLLLWGYLARSLLLSDLPSVSNAGEQSWQKRPQAAAEDA